MAVLDRIQSMGLFLPCGNRSSQRIGEMNGSRWGGRERGKYRPLDTCAAPYRIIHIAPAITVRRDATLLCCGREQSSDAPCHAVWPRRLPCGKDLLLIGVRRLLADFERLSAGLCGQKKNKSAWRPTDADEVMQYV